MGYPNFEVRNDSCSTTLSKNLNELRKSRTLVDFTIHSGQKSFPCHKLVLRTASEFFAVLDRSEWIEAKSAEIKLDNLDSHVVECLVDYIYTGVIDIKYDEIEQLLYACEMLLFDDLKNLCENFLVAILTPEICIGWYQTALLFNMLNLQLACRGMIENRFRDVAQGQEFLEMPKEQLLDCIKLAPRSPHDIFQGCLDWISHDKEKRKGSMEILLQHIDLETCSMLYMKEVLQLYSNLFEGVKIDFTKAVFMGQHAQQNAENLWVATRDVCVRQLNVLRYENKNWKQVTHAQVSYLSSFIAIQNGFVVTGGHEDGKCMKTCSHYSVVSRTWTKLPDMPFSRCNHASIYIDNVLYVFGGLYYCFRSLTIDKFNFNTHKWEVKSEMSSIAAEPISAYHNGILYVFHNHRNQDQRYNNNCMQCYNLNEDKWTKKNALPDFVVTKGTTAFTFGNAIYLVGGLSKMCCRYSIATELWCELKPCISKHLSGAVLVQDKKILLIGGRNNKAEEYDVIQNKWKSRPSYNFHEKTRYDKVTIGQFF